MKLNRTMKATMTLVSMSVATGLNHQVYAAVVTTGCVDLSSCSMAELFAGGTITVNDKKFSEFSLEFTAPFSAVPDFSKVNVSGLDDGNADPGPGLRVSSSSEFLIGGLDVMNFGYRFKADVLDPQWAIKDNSLTVATADYVMTSGGPRWEVNETVNDTQLNVLGSKQVFADAFLGTSSLSDDAIFAPQTSLLVGTNVYLEGFDTGDSAQLFAFEQRFSQVLVPLPAPLVLLSTGIAGLIGLLRRSTSAPEFPALS